MRKRLAAALCLLVVAAVTILLARDEERSTGPADDAPRVERVIQDDRAFLHEPASLGANLDEIKELGFTRLRITANWEALAPEPTAAVKPDFDSTDPAAYDRYGDPDWDKLDRLARKAAARDIELLIDIGFWAPLWAAEPTAGGSTERPRTNIDIAEYTDFARAVVRRYSGDYAPPGEVALPAVAMFSIWNEPNIPGFFGPQWTREGERRVPLSPHLYRAMLAAAFPAIREERSDTTVLVGGLAAGGADDARLRRGISPLAFIRELACVDEELNPLTRSGCDRFQPVRGDGFSIHPYSYRTPPERPGRLDNFRIGDLDRLIELLRALAERGRIDPKLVEIYITEFGYKTNPPDPEGVPPRRQLRYWVRSEEIAASYPEVRMFAQFLIRDSACEGCLFWPTGYRYADGRPKPLMAGLRSTAAGD